MSVNPLELPCVVVDARNLTDVPAGVGNYAKNLIPRMVSQADDFRWVIIRHESNTTPLHPLDDPSHYIEVCSPTHNGKVRDFILGSGNLHETLRTWGPAHIVHNLFHISPVRWSDFGPYRTKQITTLHDLIWLDHALDSQPSLLKAAWVKSYGKLSIPYTLRHSDHVICVSEATSQRASTWVDASRRTAIAHGVDDAFFGPTPELPATLARQLDDEPYAVTVSNDKPYKNVDLLVRAFALHRKRARRGKLVLIGKHERLRHVAAQLDISEHVVFAGLLAQNEMHAVVGNARLFVFPSLIEGFGLPPLEAMACGTPTAVTDREPMRSIASHGAMRFDPKDDVALSLILSRIMARDDLHTRWSKRGLERARAFTWEHTAARTLDIYREVLRDA